MELVKDLSAAAFLSAFKRFEDLRAAFGQTMRPILWALGTSSRRCVSFLEASSTKRKYIITAWQVVLIGVLYPFAPHTSEVYGKPL